MRTYKILAARAKAFDADTEVQDLLREVPASPVGALLGNYSPERMAALRDADIDVDGLAQRGLGYERLDQLLVEHLMGVRS